MCLLSYIYIMTTVCIDFANELTLRFGVYNTPAAKKWLTRLQQIDQYQLDDTRRFYGFGTPAEEEQLALNRLWDTIDTINAYLPVIQRTVTSVYDQEGLNYLHSCFEKYHGLLDQQSSFWAQANDEVRQALSDLNVNVHRCEYVQHGVYPKVVCTWYDMPKDVLLTHQDIIDSGTQQIKFGDICLNYCEIGKTLEDLAMDQDSYISDEAFQPFQHVSADFRVMFTEFGKQKIRDRLNKMQLYHAQHIDFFQKKGYNDFNDARLQSLFFPVAGLIETRPRDTIINELRTKQQVTRVYLE